MRSISLRSLNGRVPRPTRFHRPWETVTAQVFCPPGLRSRPERRRGALNSPLGAPRTAQQPCSGNIKFAL